MSKLLNTFNHTFADGALIPLELWELIRTEPSLNGFYITNPNYLTISKIGTKNGYITSWFNLIADGNYLYSTDNNIQLIENDSQFNNFPSLDFNNVGNSQLLYKFPVNVGTIVIVYLTRVAGSYLIYAPRATGGNNPLYYDGFPSGGASLWANESLDGGVAYNATSRINGKSVASNVFVPLNTARILSVKNIKNSTNVPVFGYGGQYGLVGGSENTQSGNSVKGKIAAIITFENDIDVSFLNQVETLLASYYINYTGPVLSSTPSFKYLVGTSFNFDFSTIVVDEWYDVTDYTVLSPTSLGLSFSGSILSGVLTQGYQGTLNIQVTNSGGLIKTFNFPLHVTKADPIIGTLPQNNRLTVVLSAEKSDDGINYGLNINNRNEITSWEDARRLNTIELVPDVNKAPVYLSTSDFNNKKAIRFNAYSNLLGSTYSGKTFVWVYQQLSYGSRYMLNTFPDIKGLGELWTVSNTNEIHGQTPVTKLNTKVNKVSINTLNYKLPLNTPYIITATVADDTAITFNGFNSLKGDLAFFASWDTVLTPTELNNVVATLSNRYYASAAPYVFSTATEFRNMANITIDLSKKVVDLQNSALSYNIIANHYGASITGDILSFTAVTDEVLTFSIDVTNELTLTSNLAFDVDVTLKTNPLYLSIKNIVGTSLSDFFIFEPDSTLISESTLTSWEDYRLSGKQFTGSNVGIANLYCLDNKDTADFLVNGSSVLTLDTNFTGKCYVLAYVRKQGATNRAFLLGQDSDTVFASGINGRLYDSSLTGSAVLNSNTYVNGIAQPSTYVIPNQILNTLIINTQINTTVDSIAKDRVFTDRSVKGYIPFVAVLNRNVTAQEAEDIDTAIRDYYDSKKKVALLHFDASVNDSSDRNKTITTNGNVSSVAKKFGASSFRLLNGTTAFYIEIPNQGDLAYLNEDFTISFWLALNQALSVNTLFTIYSQSDLIVYLKGQDIIVARSTSEGVPLISHTLNPSLFSTNAAGLFTHIELSRKNFTLRLFLNGIKVGETIDQLEYRDSNSPSLIGQKFNLTTGSFIYYIDEFAIFRRQALNDINFTPPSSPY